MATRELTGRHVAFIFFGSFGIIMTVNFFMAYNAVSTFPGLEVQNSYVASQHFDARREAQLALGWTVAAEFEDGTLRLSFTDADGRAVAPASLDAVLGRATHVQDDQTPEFRFDGQAFVAPADLAPGNWNIRLFAVAEDGTEFRQRVPFRVSGRTSG